MKDLILKSVQEHGGAVTFVNLSLDVAGFNGDFEFWNEKSNVVFWTGLSEAALDALLEMTKARILCPVNTSVLVYAMQGQLLPLPVAKGPPPAKGFKHRRWVPIMFCVPNLERCIYQAN